MVETTFGVLVSSQVPGYFYANERLEQLTFEELRLATRRGSNGGGFLPAVKQIANVAALPGIVKVRTDSLPEYTKPPVFLLCAFRLL